MQQQYRLKSRASFNYIYRKGASYSNKQLILYVVKSARTLKVGFSVSKKVGGSVQRNRVKRQLRECFRLMIPSIAVGYNMVFVARSTLYGATSDEIRASMRQLLERANLIDEKKVEENA